MLIRTIEFRDYYLIQIYYVIKIINSFLANYSKFIKESVQVESCPWIYLEISTIFYNYLLVADRIELVETKRSKLSYNLELLEVEISFLTRPQRLEYLAGGTMLMQPPESVQYKLSREDIPSKND